MKFLVSPMVDLHIYLINVEHIIKLAVMFYSLYISLKSIATIFYTFQKTLKCYR
jgi:hypothetical protein